MKSISKKLIQLVFISLALIASVQAQSPREQLQAAVAAYQQNATQANVEKLAGLYKQVTPSVAVPEQAEFHAQKGAAFVRLAKTPTDFERAAKEFQSAINLAPWVSEYHYNLAICYKSAEQFTPALVSLRFAQILARDDKERRDTLGLRAEIEAAQEIAAAQNKKKSNALIVPGVGMGGVQLGMLESQVIAAQGAPLSRREWHSGGEQLRYSTLDLHLDRNKKVYEVFPHKGSVTSEGIGIGSSIQEVADALGSPDRISETTMMPPSITWCYQRGIYFYFSNASPSRVETVLVIPSNDCR